MKILVAVKRVIDYNVQVRVKEDGTGVVTDNVKMSSNPPDDNAIEEAVKIKESGKATEIIAITVGEEKSQETVRKALKNDSSRYQFDYLNPGTYGFRLVKDLNNNQKWDTGNYLKKIQPEEVFYMDGEIVLRANWDQNEIFIVK